MKKWKTVFVVSGVTLALSAMCGVAYLRESSQRDKISQQLTKARFVGLGEAQRTVSSTGSIHDKDSHSIVDHDTNPKLDNKAFAQKTQELQIPFIANKGQVDKQVEFYAKTFGGTVFVTKNGEIVYALPKTEKAECRLGEAERTQQAANPQSKNPSDSSNPESAIQNPKSGIALREEFVGARVKTIQGEDPAITKVNYFKGSDPSKWKTNVSTYGAVSLGDVYDGIELRLKAYGNNVEKLFCVKPKSNPDQIKVQLSGARYITVNEEGQLVAETELGAVKFTKPVAYQEINGKRVDVSVEYRIQKSELNPKSTIQNVDAEISNPKSAIHNPKLEYGFKVAFYDHTQPLIIDPLLASTYLGGSDEDYGNSLALDTSGNVYVTGYTDSPDFPTTSGAYDTSQNGGYYDVFVSKLDGGLTTLLASTYLGGLVMIMVILSPLTQAGTSM